MKESKKKIKRNGGKMRVRKRRRMQREREEHLRISSSAVSTMEVHQQFPPQVGYSSDQRLYQGLTVHLIWTQLHHL